MIMPILAFRTKNSAEAVSVQDAVYGFTHTHIIEYNDGTWEQVRFLDSKTINEVRRKNNNA
jgi:cell division protein FtsN